jgi:cell wall-associated protease
MKNIKNSLFLMSSFILVLSCSKSKTSNSLPPKETVKGDSINDTPGADSNWFIRDPYLNQYEGVSSERAQKEFSLENKRQIIVAVIDSGVDIHHEDLKNKIWTNPGEIPNNGIDDDNNGYIDDMNGWNFLGSKDGQHVTFDTLEVTRESLRYDQMLANGEILTEKEIQYFEKVNKDYTERLTEAQDSLKELAPIEIKASRAQKTLKDKIQLEDYSVQKLEQISSSDTEVIQAKTDLLEISKNYRTVARFFRIYGTVKNSLEYFLNKKYDARKLVGDDETDFTQSQYGNNDVTGPDAMHGTHVAGLIAAEKNNGLGIDGVAENVKIMVLKVVPNGDEHDKDVVMAVRYAVQNGAQIINMSFGKDYSPFKSKVDEAFLLAAQKGILIFHSAGNGASDNDQVSGYPNRNVLDSSVRGLPEQISTWIEVGASAQKQGLNMVAPFSDYGKKDVDLFSPGYEMNSAIPGNQYAVLSGTSMASPAAAGVGALLMSNFENMTAVQAKAILLHQVRHYGDLMVHLPGSEALDLPVPFASLSASGGVIDAYRGIQFAKELSN